MRMNWKRRPFFSLIMIIFVGGFIFINQAKAQEEIGGSQITTQKTSDVTRIVISTSGPAKFGSYWLDNPPRLVVKFQSRNVLSGIDNEVIVNHGVIKRVTSTYFERGKKRALKLLTFELLEKVSYKIWQEGNTIILDIQSPLETSLISGDGKEIFVAIETSDAIIKRLEAMDTTLKQVAESHEPLEVSEMGLTTKIEEGIAEAEIKTTLPKSKLLPVTESSEVRKSMMSSVFWLVRLALISGIGFLAWRRYRPNINQKIKNLKSQLEEKNKYLKQEEIILEAIERASLRKEKEFEQLKEYVNSLKGELEKKGLVKKQLSPEEREKAWISGKSQERRVFPRLPLTRDWNKTIILKVKSQNIPQSIKSFANNISFEGLCFETKKEFNEKEPINLRLFFYGDKVPMMKIQAYIVWEKAVGPVTYYGVSFDSLEEKDELELKRYIETKMARE